MALVLLLVGDFAPISDSLEEILLGTAIVILMVFSGTYYWREWRARRADQSGGAAISSSDQT